MIGDADPGVRPRCVPAQSACFQLVGTRGRRGRTLSFELGKRGAQRRSLTSGSPASGVSTCPRGLERPSASPRPRVPNSPNHAGKAGTHLLLGASPTVGGASP